MKFSAVLSATRVLLTGAMLTASFVSGEAHADQKALPLPGRVLPLNSPLLLNLSEWMKWQVAESERRLFANISAPGTARGAVIASPERVAPDYFYVWTRDAAITMNAVLDLDDDARSVNDTQAATDFDAKLFDYVKFVAKQQLAPALAGLGEPKFEVDGSPFMGGWCRPQNDGPALRAAVLTRFANRLLKAGRGDFVKSDLYDSTSKSVIKADLEYVAHHWRDENCEPWEEVIGHHFYNQMVQRRALIDGAKLARSLGDTAAASFYDTAADQIAYELTSYWNAAAGAFVPTLNQTGGLIGKASGLDSSTILAVLHSAFENDDTPLVSFDDPKFISTIETLTNTFRTLYPINQALPLGVAIGRYPEDVYSGIGFGHGNPWVLLTAAFANSSYRIAQAKFEAGDAVAAKTWFQKGDEFMSCVQTHANPDGSLSEQIDRVNGYMTGARDLTWSHVEVIQAARTHDAVALKLAILFQ